MREVLVADPLEEPTAEAREFLGLAFGALARLAELLESEGELRGLIGPRELPRLWSRHILNSAAAWSFLPHTGTVADVGTGAGFPGLVVAAGRPELEVHLVEPMERRMDWLTEVTEELDLDNVVLHRTRADELHGRASFGAVTSRAVAKLDKLTRWCGPLLQDGGEMVALKGERAQVEVDEAEHVLRKYRMRGVAVHEVTVPMTETPARVVVARKRT
ncbi:16S rRNA (guanine(527)-N(7))-methyltransferase RsmG [Georgenia sp. 10Sc9-8]|uniref:Ribosomal RNA small subunit methyltransferase G n=1 Tax=Georgenia halotolerans TaxID=3028317 RepID=A0ABT5TX22_9MICO|nr:16S rRNA (guanine(527)-N(7))-methyltransferase RsmG [Georgenia halotolerans]